MKSEEVVELCEEDGIALHLIAWTGIIAVVVVGHLIAPEKLDRSHDVLEEDIIHSKPPSAPSVVDGVVGRRDGGVMAQMTIGDEGSPGTFVGRLRTLVVQFDTPGSFGVGEDWLRVELAVLIVRLVEIGIVRPSKGSVQPQVLVELVAEGSFVNFELVGVGVVPNSCLLRTRW